MGSSPSPDAESMLSNAEAPASPEPASRHCFAAHLGGCSKLRSREHYVSESVLRLVGEAVSISGFPWQEKGIRDTVGVSSLRAGILCKSHNEMLGPLDEAGKAFVGAIKSIFDSLSGSSHQLPASVDVDGMALELWLLKMLCGYLSAFSSEHVPRKWVDILFRRAEMPDNWGLYFFGMSGKVSWFFNLVRMISVPSKSGGIGGAKFGIGGLAMLLALGRPAFEDPRIISVHRPRSLVFASRESEYSVDLSWLGRGGRSLRLQVGEECTRELPHPRSIVGPFSTS